MDFTGGAGCSTFRLSESAVFDDASGTFLTSGLVTIGDQLHTFTSIVYTLDANWDRAAAGKNFKSLQREVFTFENGDQLTFEGPTMSVPSSAPGMFDAFGSGKFVDGTGAFTGAHGSGSLKGMTMFAPGVAETSIATYNAELCL